MKYFISIALSPEQYCIGIALTEWVTKWSKEYFINIALHSIALAHLHVIFNTNKILMQYCILLVLHYSIALASFFCLGWHMLSPFSKKETKARLQITGRCHWPQFAPKHYSPAGTLNKCSNFEESMKLCRNVEYDHLNYFSYSAIRNLIRHAIYFKLKNVKLKTLIRMTL